MKFQVSSFKFQFLKLALLLLTAHCSLLTGYAQGDIAIRRAATVPVSCDPAGKKSNALIWKTSTTTDTCGSSKGLCECTATDTWTYRTNLSSTGIVAKTMAYWNAGSAITSTAAPTDGQLLCGDTSDVPALCTPLGTANEILATLGAHSIQFGLAASVQHKAGANWLFTDTSDTAKKFQFIGSAITTANTRDINVPDSNTFLPIIPQVITVTGPTAGRTWTVFDASFTLARRNDFNAHTNVAAPATPAAGLTNTWTDATDKNFKAKDDAGVVTVTVQPSAVVSNQFLTAISTAGAVNTAQPAFSNLSGAPTAAQLYTVAESLLSTTASVDMNTATATTLFTCPSGKSCVITKVVVRNASTSLTTASYSFGWTTAAFADVIANTTHTELTGATLYTRIDAKVGATLGTSTGTFKVLMNTLQGGAATTTIDVFGYVF